MNANLKRALITNRRRRRDGTYMQQGRGGYSNAGYYDDLSYDGRRGYGHDGQMRGDAYNHNREYWQGPDNRYYSDARYYPQYNQNYERSGSQTAPYNEYEYSEPYSAYRDEPQQRRKIGFGNPYSSMQSEKKKRNRKEYGYARSMQDDVEPLTMQTAEEWVQDMENEDGTSGPHWTMDQARQIMNQQKIQCDEAEFYAALNMMYSDYCKVAKKFNCATVEFFTCMAKAFLDDKDAQDDKLARYYEYIVEH